MTKELLYENAEKIPHYKLIETMSKNNDQNHSNTIGYINYMKKHFK